MSSEPDQDRESELSTMEDLEEPASQASVGMGSIISVLSLVMFIGGALVTLMLLARSFDMHGKALVIFVIASCAFVLGLAGYLVTRIMGDKPILGAFLGAMLGGFSGFLLYIQTKSYSFWQ